MTRVLTRSEIESLLVGLDLLPLIEEGFAAYSQGRSVVPPVGELQLEKGEVHLKYGFIRDQPYYVIKIASGFYENAKLGLSTSNGCMMVFSQETGALCGVLLDEGRLTDIRTAVAGAVVAKYLAPKEVRQIGIVGTGIQAKLQLQYLRQVVRCRDVLVWGRSPSSIDTFQNDLNSTSDGQSEFRVSTTNQLDRIARECNLIVTATPSKSPLLRAEVIQPGTHVTAVGSDMPDKQELDSRILANADLVVADSIEQCLLRGEISQAIRANKINPSDVIELGQIIGGGAEGRTREGQTTIADLTGVAVQDIQIAAAVLRRSEDKKMKR